MSYHSGTIHTVRFSPNGKWLASGADDKIICIYHLDPNPAPHAGFGSNEPPPVENWKILKRLIGHDNDVQDLAWSYDSSVLVSVGLDSKIVVWSGYTLEKLKTINAHGSHVKGITFDPANKFFATASDDRTIKIWRFTSPAPNSSAHDMINNFILETTITDPFKTSPLTTYFRRCSWSPDGNHISAANSVNGPVSSIAIINRFSWDSEISLIGHEGPVEVCAFAPRLFSHESLKGLDNDTVAALPLQNVIACSGQDKALTVWNTSSARPMVVVQDIAMKSMTDICWTPDAQMLFVASLDGSIVCITFEEGDLGFAAKLEVNAKVLEKFGASRKGMGVIEDVAGLRLEERSKAGELKGAEGRMGALMGDTSAALEPEKNGIKTNGTTSGRDSPAVVITVDSSREKESSEKPKDADETDKDKASATEPAEETNAAKIEAMKKRVTITKEGRKRVAPMLVSSSGTGQSSLPQSALMTSTSSANPAVDAPQSILDLSKPYDGLPPGGLASMLLGNKRKAVAVEGEEDEHGNKRVNTGLPTNGVIPIMVNGIDGVEPAVPGGAQKGQQITPEFIRPAIVDPVLTVSQVRLSVPKIRTHIIRSLARGPVAAAQSKLSNGTTTTAADEAAKHSDDVVFEARNDAKHNPSHTEPTRITATKRGSVLWQDFLPKAVILVTGNKNFWSAVCEDSSLFVWTPGGRRLLNAMVLEAQPVILESRGWWLLCITAVGMCHVWNIKTLRFR
jgi:protein HIRA/HIR1